MQETQINNSKTTFVTVNWTHTTKCRLCLYSKTTFVTVNLGESKRLRTLRIYSKTTFVTVNQIREDIRGELNGIQKQPLLLLIRYYFCLWCSLLIQKQPLLLLILVFKGFISYNIAQKHWYFNILSKNYQA